MSKNKKALGFLQEQIAIVGGVGGIRTHARGKPSNDLAKMGKLQFVVSVPFQPLYIVVASLEISLKNVLIAPKMYGTEWKHNRNNRKQSHLIHSNFSISLYTSVKGLTR